LTFSFSITPLCVKDYKLTWGKETAITRKGPAFAVKSLLFLGLIIIASYPTFMLSVTLSGGIVVALRCLYFVCAALAAFYAMPT
jgi:hypothetical protein